MLTSVKAFFEGLDGEYGPLFEGGLSYKNINEFCQETDLVNFLQFCRWISANLDEVEPSREGYMNFVRIVKQFLDLIEIKYTEPPIPNTGFFDIQENFSMIKYGENIRLLTTYFMHVVFVHNTTIFDNLHRYIYI